jgi:hypothetical protein
MDPEHPELLDLSDVKVVGKVSTAVCEAERKVASSCTGMACSAMP